MAAGVKSIKVRVSELLVERGIVPPALTRPSVVGDKRARTLFEEAYREHARRLARAIDGQGGGASRRTREMQSQPHLEEE